MNQVGTRSRAPLLVGVFLAGLVVGGLLHYGFGAVLDFMRGKWPDNWAQHIYYAEEDYHDQNGRFLECGPAPAEIPGVQGVDWPGDACFESLGVPFEGRVYSSYLVHALGEDSFLLERRFHDHPSGRLAVELFLRGTRPQVLTAEGVP
jgi:hypothetical protein